MTEELRIWTLGNGDEAEAVESVSGVELENVLEETLVRRPAMLEPGLHLVGRQTPTEGGPLDLLGVDAGGRLVVFELKRGRLTREALTQCIDYAAALNAREPEEIGRLISEHSGGGGLDEIEDLEDWYRERFAENDLDDLLPPRLVLVGLGVDERAEQMARFLSGGGIDISVVTFFGFRHGGETFLARQVEVEREAATPPRRRTRRSARERRVALETRLAEMGLTAFFEEIAGTLRRALPDSSERTGAWGISFWPASGGGRLRLFHLWVEDSGGASVTWHASSENYNAPALEALRQEAGRRGWLAANDKYSLRIADDERWREVGGDLADFAARARRELTPAPAGEGGQFQERAWSYVRDVPSGRVVTYGQVAEALGVPGGAPAVGDALSALPGESDVPWHRLVDERGRLMSSELPEQRRRLGDEGVVVAGDSVDLDAYQWRE